MLASFAASARFSLLSVTVTGHNKPKNKKNMKPNQDTVTEPKQAALAAFLECEPEELTLERHEHYGLEIYSLGSKEFAIGDDAEADAAWDASLESYIEQCIEPELDFDKLGSLGNYVKFDREMWLRDAKMDGRGHSLSPYDGEETEHGGFYIYRIN
jgi:hypothetical protein